MQKPEITTSYKEKEIITLDDEDGDVEIQYITKEQMTEEWMLDNPSQPKVFTFSGFTPYGKYYTAEVMGQEKKALIENIRSLNASYVGIKNGEKISHTWCISPHLITLA